MRGLLSARRLASTKRVERNNGLKDNKFARTLRYPAVSVCSCIIYTFCAPLGGLGLGCLSYKQIVLLFGFAIGFWIFSCGFILLRYCLYLYRLYFYGENCFSISLGYFLSDFAISSTKGLLCERYKERRSYYGSGVFFKL